MEDPGSLAGNDISPKPERGPDAKNLISLAILKSETATVLMAPCAAT